MAGTLIVSNRVYYDTWRGVDDSNLLEAFLGISNPDTVFFPFWSDIIPRVVLDKYRCIGFHTGHLPLEAGGSPIQNLIRQGREMTELNAILLNDKIDGGKVLLKKNVSLHGSLEEILIRISKDIMEMIDELQKDNKQSYPKGHKRPK